ncbi:MAG: hypothetical protein EXX96DRAFT_578298 [Benjaminiella poitrasii]|nr:MAG: hypothetical protein EXX96DRAFT_578298 [Benjaminiella poitrasii]
MPPAHLQRLYYPKATYSQWIPILLMKTMGYSSLFAVFISMVMYWYNNKKQLRRLGYNQKDDSPCTVSKRNNRLSHLRRTSSTFSNLSNIKRRVGRGENFTSSSTRPASPLSVWSTKILSTTNLINSMIKKKKMTISLKNTILWNPSKDIDTPNHAFHENTVSLLVKLAQLYDIYAIAHITSDQEHEQIHHLLSNVNFSSPSKVFYCHSEDAKLSIIQHIRPTIHVEGGWEQDNGQYILDKLEKNRVERVIWITSLAHDKPSYNITESSHHILNTSIAKQVGF